MKFQLANREHEPALRALAADTPMPGWVRLAFTREPDFFESVAVQGRVNQVLVALENERVVGQGCRSIKPAWINGQLANIGYLGGLRLTPEVQRTGALARGYAALRQLHDAAPVPAYLTTIVDGNTQATVLTSRRAGLPHYRDWGRYITYAINLNRHRRETTPGWTVRRGDEVGFAPIERFLSEAGRHRQFFPAITQDDLHSGYLRGLHLSDFRVAVNPDASIAAAAAIWDQSTFKQVLITGYAPPVRLLRPLINGLLAPIGYRSMPAPGHRLNMLHLAFCCAQDSAPAPLRALLEHICAECRDSPSHFLVLGLHERDPLNRAMAGLPAFRYASRLYLVHWEDGLDFVNSLDRSLVPHLEAATL
jgi:hypothetical protein